MTQDEFEAICRVFIKSLADTYGPIEASTITVAFSSDDTDAWNTTVYAEGDLRPNYAVISRLRNQMRVQLLSMPMGLEIVTKLDFDATGDVDAAKN